MWQHMDRTKYTRRILMTQYADNYVIAWEQFRLSNKLTIDQMNELLSFSQGARDAVNKLAQENN